ncbi:MAG: hypothetical protein ACYTBJ_02650, partial [Planctomycetota bacterium]
MAYGRKTLWAAGMVAIVFFASGCGREVKTGPGEQVELEGTIGSFTNIFLPESMPVQGYGLVGGLNGTGSPECPSNIRA